MPAGRKKAAASPARQNRRNRMDRANLVRMANQIARNLAREPDPAAATAAHIRQFWEPRMHTALVQGGTDGLDPAVVSALALLR